ncbi:8981_t:CDS:2, partial [Dentiscutata erythropus]
IAIVDEIDDFGSNSSLIYMTTSRHESNVNMYDINQDNSYQPQDEKNHNKHAIPNGIVYIANEWFTSQRDNRINGWKGRKNSIDDKQHRPGREFS